MSLREKIDDEYKNALKSKDKNKISTYRLILSGLKDLDIQNRSGPNKKDTDDDDITKLLRKMIKQRTESIEISKKNNRQDLLQILCFHYKIKNISMFTCAKTVIKSFLIIYSKRWSFLIFKRRQSNKFFTSFFQTD